MTSAPRETRGDGAHVWSLLLGFVIVGRGWEVPYSLEECGMARGSPGGCVQACPRGRRDLDTTGKKASFSRLVIDIRLYSLMTVQRCMLANLTSHPFRVYHHAVILMRCRMSGPEYLAPHIFNLGWFDQA